MKFFHRPTVLEETNPENDRCIFADSNCIARVYRFEHGPQQGVWGWFGQWAAEGNDICQNTKSSEKVPLAYTAEVPSIPLSGSQRIDGREPCAAGQNGTISTSDEMATLTRQAHG